LGELLKLSSSLPTECLVQLLVVDRRGELMPVGAKRWIKTARPDVWEELVRPLVRRVDMLAVI